MGGIGSGNWYRYKSRQTTEETIRIDIRYLKKQNMLKPGWWFSLNWSCGGEPSGSLKYRAYHDRLVLKYRSRDYGGEWEDLEYPVYFDTTLCNYGGERKWFRCPEVRCGRRVAVLYGAGEHFLCRHCYGLSYSSQGEDRASRASRKAKKLLQRVGGDPLDDFYPVKPKGMHWKTYNQIIKQAEYWEDLSWQFIERYLAQLG